MLSRKCELLLGPERMGFLTKSEVYRRRERYFNPYRKVSCRVSFLKSEPPTRIQNQTQKFLSKFYEQDHFPSKAFSQSTKNRERFRQLEKFQGKTLLTQKSPSGHQIVQGSKYFCHNNLHWLTGFSFNCS